MYALSHRYKADSHGSQRVYIYIYISLCVYIYIYIYINTYIYRSQRNAGGALRPDGRAHCDVRQPDGRAHRVLQCTAPVSVYPSENKHIIWSRRNHNYVFVLMCLYFTPDIYFRCCLSELPFQSSTEMSVKWKGIEKLREHIWIYIYIYPWWTFLVIVLIITHISDLGPCNHPVYGDPCNHPFYASAFERPTCIYIYIYEYKSKHVYMCI